MNKEIKIKVIKLFIRFLKESSFYDELINEALEKIKMMY